MTFEGIQVDRNGDFIGVEITGDKVSFHYPWSFDFPSSEEKQLDAAAALLRTIDAYMERKAAEDETSDIEGGFPFPSCAWIIQDYQRNGMPQRFQKIEKIDGKGKIDWRRTLDQVPLFLEDQESFFYRNIYSRVNNPRDDLILEIYRYCLQRSIDLIGPLFGTSSDGEAAEELDAGKRLLYHYALESELSQTFQDERKIRLTHMRKIVDMKIGGTEQGSLKWGVDGYWNVFEMLVDDIFSTESTKPYNPKAKWHIDGDPKEYRASVLRPDTIMIVDRDLFILDSKYYTYGQNLENRKGIQGLPGSSSIQKQIAYGQYSESRHQEKFSSSNIYNVFILPYKKDAEQSNPTEDGLFRYIGYAYMESGADKKYHRVQSFLIDLSSLIDRWINKAERNNKTIRNRLAELVKGKY